MKYKSLGDNLIEEDHLQLDRHEGRCLKEEDQLLVDIQEGRRLKEEGQRLKEEEGHLLVVGQEEHRLMT